MPYRLDKYNLTVDASVALQRSGSTTTEPVQSKRQPPLGGASFSLPKQDQTLDNHKPMFQIGDSSKEDGSLKHALSSQKQASFSANATTRTIEDEAAVDSDTDYIEESAIDDDDSSDWEDSIEGSGKSSVDDKFFQRVDSNPNLTSRSSLITLMLAKNYRARTPGTHASQSTSAILRSCMPPNGPSLGASPNDSDEALLTMKGKRYPRSSAQPIVIRSGHAQGQAVLSPRTTRQNMVATELTESLRGHILWERQQKSSTANAVLKRCHTSHHVANLNQNTERSCISEDVNASWNQCFFSNGYHFNGW
ncbi:hypothetical protein EDB80DRAFT_258057 [Ilyonectria destructans]|nr:hypothetical protein EDB80DRAFT_258057 [Ilyonectria destructans]